MIIQRDYGDPGPCIICGAPHTSCTGDAGPTILVPLVQSRDIPPPGLTHYEKPGITTKNYRRPKKV